MPVVHERKFLLGTILQNNLKTILIHILPPTEKKADNMITSIWPLWHFLMSYTVSVILIDLFASRRVHISQPFLLDTPLKSRPGALSLSFETLRHTLEIYIWCIRIKDPYLSKKKSCVIKISSS